MPDSGNGRDLLSAAVQYFAADAVPPSFKAIIPGNTPFDLYSLAVDGDGERVQLAAAVGEHRDNQYADRSSSAFSFRDSALRGQLPLL